MTRNLDVPLMEDAMTRFEILWQESKEKAMRYALKLSGNTADAEDLMADAYLRACRKFDGYQSDRPFENWIYRIMDRLNIDRCRMQSRRVRAVSYDAPYLYGTESMTFEVASDQPTPEEELVDSIPSEELQAALKGLNTSYRRLLIDVFVRQMTIKELAEEGETCEGTLRSRLHRAIKQVKSNMGFSDEKPLKARI